MLLNVTWTNQEIADTISFDKGFLRITDMKATIYNGKYFDYYNKRQCYASFDLLRTEHYVTVEMQTHTCFSENFQASFNLQE